VCAPKGAAFLHVRRDRQQTVRPLAISHGTTQVHDPRSRFQREFDWTGTDDPSPWLAAPEAMDLHEACGGAHLRAANHALVRDGRVVIAEHLGVELPHPDDPALYGSMATIPLPAERQRWQEIMDRLFHEHRIEVPVFEWCGRAWVRISGQIYNRPEQYEVLARALGEVLGTG